VHATERVVIVLSLNPYFARRRRRPVMKVEAAALRAKLAGVD
jgi:hypothetical protein